MPTLETTRHPDDPGPTTPPAWPEQEWCDGGWTCEHSECVEELNAALDDLDTEQLDADTRRPA